MGAKEFWQAHSIKPQTQAPAQSQQPAPAIKERSEQARARAFAANTAHGARLAKRSPSSLRVDFLEGITTGPPGERFREEQVARVRNKVAKGEATLDELRVVESGLQRQREFRRKPRKES